MAYFRYRNRNANNRFNRVRFNQPFSFRRREKVEVEDKLPLNMIISEPASRDQVCPYSTLQECLANSGTMPTKTHPLQQEVHADILNNYSHNTQYAETKKNHCTQADEDITFNYREDINYDLNSTCCSESGLKDKSFFSSDRSSPNLESDNDVCPKYPDKRINLQKTESNILKNINYKNYVPRVQPFLAVFSPKKKKGTSQLQPIKEVNKVTDEYSVQPYFEWSKQKFISQKRRHEFETRHPPYKVSKNIDSRAELGKLSPTREHKLNIPPAWNTDIDFTWKPRKMAKENNEESGDITFLYKSFNQLPFTAPMNDTNSSFQFVPNIDEELKEK